jgi:hypothetical protein
MGISSQRTRQDKEGDEGELVSVRQLRYGTHAGESFVNSRARTLFRRCRMDERANETLQGAQAHRERRVVETREALENVRIGLGPEE